MNDRPSLSGPASEGDSRASTFEVAMRRLTEIVQTLEQGDLPLEESLRLFEEGIKLARLSQARLDAAEKRVEQLLTVDDKGRTQTVPFDTDAASSPSD